MRIVHVTHGRCNPESANGIDKTIIHLSRAQLDQGHDVSVFSISPKKAIALGPVRTWSFDWPLGSLSVPSGLTAALSRIDPDIVHLHSTFVLELVLLARWLRRNEIRYAVTPHGGLSPLALRRRRWRKRTFKTLAERGYWNGAALIHAVSGNEVDHLRSYGIRTPVVVAPNAIDLNAIPPPSGRRPPPIERSYPQMRGKKIFLFMGRLDVLHKGLDLLLDSWEAAAPELAQSVLLLVGPDPGGTVSWLQSRAVRGGFRDQLMVGRPIYGSEKWDLFHAADVYVQTSRWEGLPFSVLEAAAARLPSLVTPAADPNGQIAVFEAGLVSPFQKSAVSRALVRLSAMPVEDLSRLGENGYRMIQSQFNWANSAATLVDAYANHN